MESSVSMTLSPRNLKQGLSMLHDPETPTNPLILRCDASRHAKLYAGIFSALLLEAAYSIG